MGLLDSAIHWPHRRVLPILRELLSSAPHLGLPCWWRFLAAWGAAKICFPGSGDLRLSPRESAVPLMLRRDTSDIDSFRQIFVERELRWFQPRDPKGILIEAGACTGFASAFCLSRFPGMHSVALEPDPENFGMLERNLAGFGSRVRLRRWALWPSCEPLRIERRGLRESRHWSRRVRPPRSGEEAEVEGIDLATLLRRERIDRVEFLLMDVEGAETAIFASQAFDWVDRVDQLALEWHATEGLERVTEILGGRGFRRQTCGELAIFGRSPC